MGLDTHMIAGGRACLTFTPNRSAPAYADNPALCRDPATTEMASRVAAAIQQRLAVVLQVAEQALETSPNRAALKVY